ncbi:MAG: thiol peroxidase [Bacteroidales bacterium]
MATVTLKGNQINTSGNLPKVGSKVSEFTLVKSDLSELSLSELKGKKVILNIFPSLDTAVCAASVRKFNAEAVKLDNVVVGCISKDLPFAAGRFCTVEGLNNVVALSGFRDVEFGKHNGVDIVDGPLKGLYARAIIIVNEEGVVTYEELVPEITQEPNYQAALDALK